MLKTVDIDIDTDSSVAVCALCVCVCVGFTQPQSRSLSLSLSLFLPPDYMRINKFQCQERKGVGVLSHWSMVSTGKVGPTGLPFLYQTHTYTRAHTHLITDSTGIATLHSNKWMRGGGGRSASGVYIGFTLTTVACYLQFCRF